MRRSRSANGFQGSSALAGAANCNARQNARVARDKWLCHRLRSAFDLDAGKRLLDFGLFRFEIDGEHIETAIGDGHQCRNDEKKAE